MTVRNSLRRRLRSPNRRTATGESKWFWDHYELAAREIVTFCDNAGLNLRGLTIADIGCGDGIMALGLSQLVSPRKLVGFDVNPVDLGHLLFQCRAEGVLSEIPAQLEFRQSSPSKTPAEDGEFDFVYSWSAFEHIGEPLDVLREIHRVLRPTGHFFLQLWPFYHSPKGSHLWDWFDDDFHHLREDEQEIVNTVLASDRHEPGFSQYMAHEFQQLNRITLEQLQRVVLEAGFDVARLELLSAPVTLTPDLGRYRWTDLGIGGIKLLARPTGTPNPE